jgi:hypothetical protein
MAQADSVPSSTRQLITGESANQSTNLRALNLPAVRAAILSAARTPASSWAPTRLPSSRCGGKDRVGSSRRPC